MSFYKNIRRKISITLINQNKNPVDLYETFSPQSFGLFVDTIFLIVIKKKIKHHLFTLYKSTASEKSCGTLKYLIHRCAFCICTDKSVLTLETL